MSCSAFVAVISVTSSHTATKYRVGRNSIEGTLNSAPDMAVPLHNDVTVALTNGQPTTKLISFFVCAKVEIVFHILFFLPI